MQLNLGESSTSFTPRHLDAILEQAGPHYSRSRRRSGCLTGVIPLLLVGNVQGSLSLGVLEAFVPICTEEQRALSELCRAIKNQNIAPDIENPQQS